MDLFNSRSDGKFAFGNWEQKRLLRWMSSMEGMGAVNVKKVADLIGGELAVTVEEEA